MRQSLLSSSSSSECVHEPTPHSKNEAFGSSSAIVMKKAPNLAPNPEDGDALAPPPLNHKPDSMKTPRRGRPELSGLARVKRSPPDTPSPPCVVLRRCSSPRSMSNPGGPGAPRPGPWQQMPRPEYNDAAPPPPMPPPGPQGGMQGPPQQHALPPGAPVPNQEQQQLQQQQQHQMGMGPMGVPPHMMMGMAMGRGAPGPMGMMPLPGSMIPGRGSYQPHPQYVGPGQGPRPGFPGYGGPPGMAMGPMGPRGPMPMMGGRPPRPYFPGQPMPMMAVLPQYIPGTASLFEQLDKQILVRFWGGSRDWRCGAQESFNLDKTVVYGQVILRDGRHLVGVMRSFDQYSNMVLEDTFERHMVRGECTRISATHHAASREAVTRALVFRLSVVAGMYGDIPLGCYIVRGDNVVLLGEVDPEKESASEHLTRVTAEVSRPWGGDVSRPSCSLSSQ
jgi:U6 snRNA-associated Sm-like protein LSm1